MTREEAIRILASNCISGSKQTEALETLIPELAESEDERMMREFNDWLCEEIECLTNDLRDEEDRRTLNMLCYVLKKVKDWLEKQKEQKIMEQWPNISGCKHDCKHCFVKCLYRKEENDEQKPADLSEMMGHKEPYIAPVPTPMIADERKQEWSEEDRLHYVNVLGALEYVKGCKSDYDKIEAVKSDIDWLKSLKPHWKPSEEQMDALQIAAMESKTDFNTLTSLLADLMKL